jgi:hypothetical protein
MTTSILFISEITAGIQFVRVINNRRVLRQNGKKRKLEKIHASVPDPRT